MVEVNGNIWTRYCQPDEFIVITTNNILTHKGLVMGAGIALAAKDRCPWLPEYWAAKIGQHGIDYHILAAPNNLIALQTKKHYKDHSPISLIEASLEALAAKMTEDFPSFTINMPRPGCGNGGLDWDTQVKPICERICKGNKWIIWNH